MDHGGYQSDNYVQQDKEPQYPEELAEYIAGVREGPGEDDLGGIRPSVPFEKFRRHKKDDDSLVDIEELKGEEGYGSRQGPEVVGDGKGWC
jgi:hypothetical protein